MISLKHVRGLIRMTAVLLGPLLWARPCSGQISERPFVWASSWERVPAGLDFITPQLLLEGSFDPSRPNEGLNPEALARQTQQLPKGRRALRWVRYFNSFWSTKVDALVDSASNTAFPGPWQNTAIARVVEEWSRWLFLFKYCGGGIDILVGDCEQDGCLTSWGLKAEQIPLLAGDPRWSRSFYGLPPLSELMNGVRLDRLKSAPYTGDYLTWNLQMGRFANAVLTTAIWGPAVKEFPNLVGSNYQGMRATDRPAPTPNGHPQPYDNVFGTSAAPALYGINEAISTFWFIDPNDPTKLNMKGSQRLPRGPWSSLIIDQQTIRCCRRSAPDVSITPWIASPAWPGSVKGTVGYPDDPRYFDESIRHSVLLGTDFFLWWNPSHLPVNGEHEPHVDNDRLAIALNELLREINSQTGGRVSRSLTVEPLRLDAQLVTSGAECGAGRYVWRTTVSPTVRGVIDRKTGVRKPLAPQQVGWWDITDEPRPPDYEVDLPGSRPAADTDGPNRP
jgi:hypothetical protein